MMNPFISKESDIIGIIHRFRTEPSTVENLVVQAHGDFPNPSRYVVNQGTSIRALTGVNRRPDVWVLDIVTQQVVKVYEAARKLKSGLQWVKRERLKEIDYQSARLLSHFEEVR